MRSLIISFIFLLVSFNCLAELTNEVGKNISWQKTIPGGFSATMKLSSNKINIDQNLEIDLILTFPITHQPEWKNLIPQLLTFDAFEPAPFTLQNQKLKPQTSLDDKIASQQLTIMLTPRTLGTHYLTFYDIQFKSISENSKGVVTIISDIVSIEVSSIQFNFQPALIMAAPMPLAEELPITPSISNKRAFILNDQLAKEATIQNKYVLQSKTIPWQLFAMLITLSILYMIILQNRSTKK